MLRISQRCTVMRGLSEVSCPPWMTAGPGQDLGCKNLRYVSGAWILAWTGREQDRAVCYKTHWILSEEERKTGLTQWPITRGRGGWTKLLHTHGYQIFLSFYWLYAIVAQIWWLHFYHNCFKQQHRTVLLTISSLKWPGNSCLAGFKNWKELSIYNVLVIQ